MKNVKAFNTTAQGANHIKRNKVCQDSSKSFYDDGKLAFAIVCDGHGGDDYVRSDIGSLEAATVASDCIREFVSTVLKTNDLGYVQRHYEEVLRDLAASIISKWREKIEKHFYKNPLTEQEIAGLSDKAKKKYAEGNVASAYGTTLIAVVFTDAYWFGIKVGDGKCVAISKNGEFSMPIPDDGICFLNATTSICDKNAIDNFRYAFSCERPAAVFIGTDGIDDCFNRDEQLFNLYKTTLYSFVTSDYDKAISDLTDYLPRLSAKGSGDDVSVGAVIDFDIAEKLDIIQNFDTTPKVVSETGDGENNSEITKEQESADEIGNIANEKKITVTKEIIVAEENIPIEDQPEKEKLIEPSNTDNTGNETTVSIQFNNNPQGTYIRINNGRILKAAPPTTVITYGYSAGVNTDKVPDTKNVGGHKDDLQ